MADSRAIDQKLAELDAIQKQRLDLPVQEGDRLSQKLAELDQLEQEGTRLQPSPGPRDPPLKLERSKQQSPLRALPIAGPGGGVVMIREESGEPELDAERAVSRFMVETALEEGAFALATKGRSLLGAPGRIGRSGQRLAELTARGAGATAGSALSESFDPTSDPEFAVKLAGTIAVAADVVPSTIMKLALVGRRSPKLTEEAERVLERFEGSGVSPTLAQIRGRNVLENIAAGSVTGSSRVAQARGAAQLQATDFVRAFVENLEKSGDREIIGNLLSSTLETSRLLHKEVTRSAFRTVDQAVGFSPIPVDRIAKATERALAGRTIKRGAQTVADDVLDVLSNPTFVDSNGNISLSRLQDLRSELLDVSRTAKVGDFADGRRQAFAKELIPILTKEMDLALEEHGTPFVRDLYQAARALWAQGHDEFGDSVISQVARTKDGVQALAKVLRPNRPRDIRLVRKNVPPELWGEVKAELVKRFFSLPEAIDTSINASARTIRNRVQSFGREGLREAFEQSELRAIDDFISAIEISQRDPGGIGKMLIQMKTAGAFQRGMTIGIKGLPGLLSVTLAPAVFSKLVTSPSFVSLVNRGVRAAPGTKDQIRAFSEIVSFAARNATLDRPERQENTVSLDPPATIEEQLRRPGTLEIQ